MSLLKLIANNMRKLKGFGYEVYSHHTPKKDDDNLAKVALIFISIMLCACIFATFYLYQLENYYN